MIYNTTLQDQLITIDISTLPFTQSPPLMHIYPGGQGIIGHPGKGHGHPGTGPPTKKYNFTINTYSSVKYVFG